MKRSFLTLRSNRQIAPSIYEMVLDGDVAAVSNAGQFVEISLEGLFLRRPISVCDYTDKSLTLVYKCVGRGTRQMAELKPGVVLDVLCGLGNGFNVEQECRHALLVGGGVGTPPLYALARQLKAKGRQVTVVLGFNTASEVFYAEEFKALGVDVVIATADGSCGVKGFVTDAIRTIDATYDYFYSCGPLPMLKALSEQCTVDGELSLEERMGCGFGICMGCSIMTRSGAKRVCKEGPVFKKEDIIW